MASARNCTNEIERIQRQFRNVDEANTNLTAPFTMDEFRRATFQMHPDKSPGPDGFNPAFHQKFWPLVSNDLLHNCANWFQHLQFFPELNKTNIVLVPKCAHPTTMKDLRPIAFCDVVYKILAKVLANHLKNLLPLIISEAQSVSVPGRSICDNVLAAFELIHYMKRRTKGKQGNVVLKIDISKAYERIN